MMIFGFVIVVLLFCVLLLYRQLMRANRTIRKLMRNHEEERGRALTRIMKERAEAADMIAGQVGVIRLQFERITMLEAELMACGGRVPAVA